jgi:hypothetical protein
MEFNNLMEFNKKVYLQLFGIATGTNLAPALANIYLALLEKEIREDHTHDPKFKWPLLLYRFIDDLLGIMDGTREEILYFISIFNEYDSSIKLEPIQMGSQVELDLDTSRNSTSIPTSEAMRNIPTSVPRPNNMNIKSRKRPPPTAVFKIPFHVDLLELGFSRILKKHLMRYCGKSEAFRAVFMHNMPLVCWTKSKNIASFLVNAKHC